MAARSGARPGCSSTATSWRPATNGSSSHSTSRIGVAGREIVIPRNDEPAFRLLLVSAGSVVGQKLVATLRGRRDGLCIVGTSSVANEPALFDLDRVHLVEPTADDPHRFERR